VQHSFFMQFMAVGVGGFFGAGLRFALGSWIHRALPAAAFPWGTMAVNLLGCLLIGFVASYRQPLEPGVRLFLMVGLLGGFTTFSTFALETLALTQQDNYLMAAVNVTAKVVFGLLAAWAGFELGRLLAA